MRAFRAKSFLIKRDHAGWVVHGEGVIYTGTDILAREINVKTFGKIRFLAYLRAVFALRSKARTMRAKPGVRESKGWIEDFVD